MKYLISIFSVLIIFLSSNFSSSPNVAANIHSSWNTLLKKHVSSSGNVSYNGFKADVSSLNQYLNLLKENQPTSNWSKNEKLAYWINVYNANTISLMVKNWPVTSIKKITQNGKGPWDIPFIKLEGKTYSLNDIENNIIRKRFNEPRIHFAVNCAAKGCPPLRNEAFMSAKLNSQLQEQTTKFINNPNRNTITSTSVQLSKIFDWYKVDFTKNGSLVDFINKYAKIQATTSAKITFNDYNWEVNK